MPNHLERFFDHVMAAVSQMIREARTYVAEHGTAVATTWSAKDDASKPQFANTVAVTSGKSAAIIGDDGDSGLAKDYVDVASVAWGLQYAPRGGERMIMIPTETVPTALILHGYDDSFTSLKPGETILQHWSGEVPNGGMVNASVYFANDAVSTGDNLAKIAALAGGFLSAMTTAGYGLTVTDSSGAIVVTATTVQLGNSSTTTIMIGGGGTNVEIGGSGTSSNDGVVRKSDLQTALNNYKAAEVTANVTNAGAIVVPTVTASTTTFTA